MLALDGVGLGQLSEIRDKVAGQRVPRLAVWHAKVYVGAGELIDVKLDGAGACKYAARATAAAQRTALEALHVLTLDRHAVRRD